MSDIDSIRPAVLGYIYKIRGLINYRTIQTIMKKIEDYQSFKIKNILL